eukprot:m.145977 g.145977  ORF g.145977 m.145977 type:complete len:819 (-) comp14959_c0_seq7:1138-3594(-)
MGNSSSEPIKNPYLANNQNPNLGERLIAGQDPEDSTFPALTEHAKKKSIFESLNYDNNEDGTFYKEHVHASKRHIHFLETEENIIATWKWIMCFIIGCLTAITAFFIDYVVDKLFALKFTTVEPKITQCEEYEVKCLILPWFMTAMFNIFFVFIAASVCAFVSQAASGSGIPEIKSFLNGISYAPWITLKTMLVKVFGVLFSVGASMPVGKEGPMIHSGAIIAAVAPRYVWRRSSKNQISDNGRYFFRTDSHLRDFVSGGAAAGVAAAFGAPIGGVLFSLEEGASFWNQALTWRVLFTSISTLLVMNTLVSGILKKGANGGGWGNLAKGGLIDFGSFSVEDAHDWDYLDLIIFILMGAVGGLLGAVWNWCQLQITKYRRRRTKWNKYWMVTEACFISLVNTTIYFAVAMSFGTCEHKPSNETLSGTSVKGFFCSGDEYNDMASLAFNTFENSIKDFFHYPGNFQWYTCLGFFIMVATTACWTYGLMIPSGLFVPSIAAGAGFGRMVGELMYMRRKVNRGTYALVGAAAFLGGVVRMTISLTVILVEATNQVGLSFPIMVTLLLAKWVGDIFNHGIYDIHIHLKKIPVLEPEAEETMKRFVCLDVMSTDVVCVERLVRVSDLIAMLKSNNHNGFPVVYEHVCASTDPKGRRFKQHGRLIGNVLRQQMLIVLKFHRWGKLSQDGLTIDKEPLNPDVFTTNYPIDLDIHDMILPGEGEVDDLWIDLKPYMNLFPYTLQPYATLTRAYVLFRGLGLRHIPIVDEDTQVVGYISRVDLSIHNIEELSEHDTLPELPMDYLDRPFGMLDILLFVVVLVCIHAYL